MVNKIYSVFDIKAKFFNSPYVARNDEEAIRIFSGAVNDARSLLSQHPSDFKLYYIGDFDLETGILTSVNPVIYLITANDLLVRPSCHED